MLLFDDDDVRSLPVVVGVSEGLVDVKNGTTGTVTAFVVLLILVLFLLLSMFI
jgi:hypothetical protein